MTFKNSANGEAILVEIMKKAVNVGANIIEIENKDGFEEIYAISGSLGVGIEMLKSNTEQSIALRAFLQKHKKGAIVKVGEDCYKLKIHIWDSFGEDAYRIVFKKKGEHL